jgi:hypothetical protein
VFGLSSGNFATATPVAGRPPELARGRKPEDLPAKRRSVPRTQAAGRLFFLARVRNPCLVLVCVLQAPFCPTRQKGVGL